MIVKGFRGMFTGVRWIVAFIYFVTTVVTSINAISRYFFKYVIFGSEEFCTYAVIIMAYLMFPIMEAEDRHLRIDIFENSVKNRTLKEIVRVIRGIVTMGVCGTIAFYGWRVTSIAYSYKSTSPTLNIPKSIVYGITMASFVFVVLGWICSLLFNKRRPL